MSCQQPSSSTKTGRKVQDLKNLPFSELRNVSWPLAAAPAAFDMHRSFRLLEGSSWVTICRRGQSIKTAVLTSFCNCVSKIFRENWLLCWIKESRVYRVCGKQVYRTGTMLRHNYSFLFPVANKFFLAPLQENFTDPQNG